MVGIKERKCDLVFLAIAGVIFWEGYGLETPWTQASNSVTIPFLILAAFLGIMYPFRAPSRLLWIAAAPFIVFALPSLGYNVHLFLNRAPGLDEPYLEYGMFFFTLACYVTYVALWLVPGAIGWRLEQTI